MRDSGGAVALSGERVRLREFGLGDAGALHRVLGDERVAALLSFDSHTADQVDELLDGLVREAATRPRTHYRLAVTAPDGELVGFALLLGNGAHAAKLGYAVGYEHRGKGYTADAIRTLLGFAFGPLGLHRVTAALGPDNTGSIALLERLGFTREGVLRDHVHTGGAWRDSVLLSLLAPEWA